ncbi:hypothetical protein N7457_002174 [Penicillium paradoxum]|uniref:uncharacterized protein n=1 Tax=Penicillium paradoxum TaxID=176176 RepID=UPI002546AB0D|nr:uncharacterized protein N7457_002174 [Penicillium paradoxum]KAJ5787184.1 hypothetical protein N7457_002174 [Penicillium paradoxum]
MHFIPTPPGSLVERAAMHARQAAEGTYNRSVSSFQNEKVGQKSAFAKSLSSLDGSREELVPPVRNRTREGFIGSSSENLQNLVADWAQYMGSNPNDFRTASSASLAAQNSGIMISKRRQPTGSPETHSEARVPHLGDLDLSHRLAGTSMMSTPPSNNPSMLDLPRPNRYGVQMASQENLQSCERSGSSTMMGSEPQKQDVRHQRDASSFYSGQSSNPSGCASPAVQSVRVHAANAMGTLPNIHTQMVERSALEQNGTESSAEVLKSKFVEQLEWGNSRPAQVYGMPNGAESVGSQRKVSPGWMTGGRRVGYGYTLVDNDDDHSPTAGVSGSPARSNRHTDNPGPTSNGVNGHKLNTPATRRTDVVPATQPVTPDQVLKGYNSRGPPMATIPVDTRGGPILTPAMWAKMKSHSIRRNGHAPLVVDLASEGRSVGQERLADSDHAQQNRSPTSPKVDYVEDTNHNSSVGWAIASRSTSKRAPPTKYLDSTHIRDTFTPETSPRDARRISMDQTNRPPSVYFDPSNNRSADKINGEPSRSRSGRWVLRFSRNRESKKRSNIRPKEPSQEWAAQYQEHLVSSLQRADSTRSNAAEELASAYQDCIQMPGAFYGSRWASRTSLVVEAE